MEISLMFCNDKDVLVTWSGDFIGSHPMELLSNNNAHVKALVHYRSYGDNRKIRAEIGWKPEIELNESLKKTLNFYIKE